MRKLTCIAIAAALLASLTGCGAVDKADRWVEYGPHGETTGEVIITLGECATEDSDNCYWDASSHGNGEGTSFVNIDGVTYYPEGS